MKLKQNNKYEYFQRNDKQFNNLNFTKFHIILFYISFGSLSFFMILVHLKQQFALIIIFLKIKIKYCNYLLLSFVLLKIYFNNYKC